MFGADPAQVVGTDEDKVRLHKIVLGEVNAVGGVVGLPIALAFQVEQVSEYGFGGFLMPGCRSRVHNQVSADDSPDDGVVGDEFQVRVGVVPGGRSGRTSDESPPF